MRIFIGLIFSSLLLFGFEYKLEPVKVHDNVTCFFGKHEPITKDNGGHIANCCYVSTINGFVVIDSGPTYHFAETAYSQMIQSSPSTPRKVVYVINTHKHDDHWLGNNFYKELGATILGPHALKHSVGKDEKTRMQKILTPLTYAKTNIVYADRYIEKKEQIKVGKTTFVIEVLADTAHTDGDLFVYIPEEIIFVGDLVFNDRLLSLRDGDLHGWLRSLEKIEALSWKKIVSGHGDITDKTALVLTKSYLQDLKKEVKEALENDVELDEITKVVRLEKYKDIPMYTLLNNQNILKAYQLLEFEEE